MLRNTFLHLPGVGEFTERRIWSSGITTWMDFMRAAENASLSARRMGRLRSGVVESIQRLEGEDWSYFEQCLPGRHKWRAYGECPNDILYVDIETDGGLGPDSITIIGTYDGSSTRLFVEGEDLHEAGAVIASYPVVGSFNGAAFDMPLIRARFPSRVFNQIHIDLMYPLRRLGFTGGLKAIEQRLGIARAEDTAGLDGWDAVRLWAAYREGSRQALDLLLAYNEEDVCHLKPLMEFVYREMATRFNPARSEA